MEPITLDFETEAIVGNPLVHPPKAVGLAVYVPGEEPTYLAWGHPTGNNIYFGDAHKYAMRLAESGQPFLFHNAPFDLSVWNNTFSNAQILWINQGWKRHHDTMPLLFLADPYASTYSLKPSAERWLAMPPEEQSALEDWIVANISGTTRKTAGAYISQAPVDLVGPYAIGDVVRTRRLFDLLHPKIVSEGMEQAYDRERRIMPTLVSATRRGVRIDRDLLDHHTTVYSQCLDIARDGLCSVLSCSRDTLESDSLLADALDKAGAIEEWVLTPTGKRSMAKGNLRIKDPNVKLHMAYISSLETCLQTFMRPWLALSETDGRLHPNWNSVRQSRGGGNDIKGARTGRLSSDSPNFQNVPTEFTDNKGVALATPEGLHPLPMLRRYCLPEPGHIWLKRDYSSQEIRICAHFEDGSLCEAYRANPQLDPHSMAQELIQAMIGITYARPSIKITAFSIIYGSGATGLSVQLGSSYQEAWSIKEAYLSAMPGIRELMRDVQSRGRSGSGIRTWGGRKYYSEPPKMVNGQWRDFHYKLLNYLIQGSAADQTKESIADWEETRHWEDVFLATVHDEINISVPSEGADRGMRTLRHAMERPRLDVPVLSEGFIGENWQELIECA
jgi:DNA polymerase I